MVFIWEGIQNRERKYFYKKDAEKEGGKDREGVWCEAVVSEKMKEFSANASCD